MTGWRPLAERLADDLRDAGDLHRLAWHQAVSAIPRHLLVPTFYEQRPDATWQPVEATSDLDLVYSDTTLVTVVDDRGVAVSSSTAPGLMTAMLEALDVRDGHTVLEVGTATGYNAALLSHRLGAEHVTSVDLDPQLVDAARDRLARLGCRPALYARDGAAGVPERAPYDRLIATCAVPAIPAAWVEQTRPGGRLLADLKPGSGLAGNLVLLDRHHDRAEGRFLDGWAGFMPMRHRHRADPGALPRRDHATAHERTTTAPIAPWEHPVPWFLAHLDDGMPDGLTYGARLGDTGETTWAYLATPDGSWCELTSANDRPARVLEAGPVSLWARFETAYQSWCHLGEPGWSRFGLTVTSAAQAVWLDSATGPRWNVPPTAAVSSWPSHRP